jgi:hypothetical protein
MKRRGLVGCCVLSILVGSPVLAQDRVRLFLGPPSENVFAKTGGDYADTYDDVRKLYRENPELQSTIELVERPDLADLALMVTFRGRVGTLRRTNQVNARLFAIGTDYSIDLDGLEGIDWGSFSNQAKSLLRQTVEWAAANKDTLPRFRPPGRPVEAVPNPVAGPTVLGLFLPPPPDQTPGVELRLQEMKRTRGPEGTRIRYRVISSGFPEARTYTVTFERPLSSVFTLTDVRADKTGALREGRVEGKKTDLSRTSIEGQEYTRGEAHRVRVVSTDGTVRASATVFPFPIYAQEGDCLVWAEVVSTDYDRYEIGGRGFMPGAQIALTMTGTKNDAALQVIADPTGSFLQRVLHQGSGEAVLEVVSPSCQMTIRYGFGDRGRTIQ